MGNSWNFVYYFFDNVANLIYAQSKYEISQLSLVWSTAQRS